MVKSITEKLNFIRSVFGKYTLSRNGMDAAVRCPSCQAAPTKRKLSIRLDNDFYHCWVCGIKGRNLLYLLKKFARPEAIDIYLREFLSAESTHQDENVVASIFLPEDFSLILNATSRSSDPDFMACLRYLRTRGLTDADIWFFKVGVSNEFKFRRKVILPSFDGDGNLNFWVSRTIDDHVVPKYLNCHIDRNSMIFNELNINWVKPVILVEGPFDLIKAGDNAIPLLGSGLSYESRLFSTIANRQPDIYLALDTDVAEKSGRIAIKLSSFGCNVFRVPLGSHEDVGAMSREDFSYCLNEAVPWDMWSHVMDKISDIGSRSIL
jgi:DNA primase